MKCAHVTPKEAPLIRNIAKNFLLFISLADIPCNAETPKNTRPMPTALGDPAQPNVQTYPLNEYVHAGLCKRLPALHATYTGHTGSVLSVNFNLDGNLLVSGSNDTTVKVWDTKTGACLHTLHGHNARVESTLFSPDGELIVSGSIDGTIKIWHTKTGDCLHTLREHKDRICSIAFSPDGTLFATGSADKTVKIWLTHKAACIQTLFGHKTWVETVAFNRAGTTVASGSGDERIKLWNVKTGTCTHTMLTRPADLLPDGRPRLYEGRPRLWVKVALVAFNRDGTTVTSISTDGLTQKWDAVTGECVLSLSNRNRSIWKVAFSPDETLAASSSLTNEENLTVWNASTGASKLILPVHADSVSAIAFSPNGIDLASGSTDRTVKIWKINHRTELNQANLNKEMHRFIYQAAHDWNNELPHKVHVLDPIYQAVIQALPFFNDDRLFITQH